MDFGVLHACLEKVLCEHIMCRISEGESKHDRKALDRRRLEMAHLQYALLRVCEWYPDKLHMSKVAITPGDLDAAITTVGEVYYSLFAEKYASKSSNNAFNINDIEVNVE